jgi:hypothetical protein
MTANIGKDFLKQTNLATFLQNVKKNVIDLELLLFNQAGKLLSILNGNLEIKSPYLLT